MSVYRKYQPRGAPAATVANPATDSAALRSVATLAIVAGPASNFALCDDANERAAIVNVDGGIPSPWSDAFAQMLEMETPPGVFADEWVDLCNAAGVLLDRWGSQLAALGWSTGETLGICPERHGWDSNCLLSALVGGVRVGVASGNAVTLIFPDGTSRAMLRNSKGWLYE
jgi:hypothetical protein